MCKASAEDSLRKEVCIIRVGVVSEGIIGSVKKAKKKKGHSLEVNISFNVMIREKI